MKTLFFLILLLLSSIAYSQGNLQFNQVKLIGDSPQTVPTGKVWKIESAPLTVKNGIRVPPTFIMGTDTIVMGYDSYTTTNLENVISVGIEYKGSGCFYPVSSIVLHLDGVGNGSNILSQDLSFPNISVGASNYKKIGTVNLAQFSSNNIISSFFLSLASSSQYTGVGCTNGAAKGGWNYNFRITFYLANGNSVIYNTSSNTSPICGTCCSNCFSDAQGIMPTITANSETRSRPAITTQFPIWLPSGTAVRTFTNISKLSVIEFNIVQ